MKMTWHPITWGYPRMYCTWGGSMKLPKLPTPETVDGRLMYTAGQMREYGRFCFNQGAQLNPYVAPKQTETPQNDTVDFLRGMMGMK